MSELDSKKESNTTLRVWIAILTGLLYSALSARPDKNKG